MHFGDLFKDHYTAANHFDPSILAHFSPEQIESYASHDDVRILEHIHWNFPVGDDWSQLFSSVFDQLSSWVKSTGISRLGFF